MSVTDELIASYAESASLIAEGHELPSPREVAGALADARELIFPGFTGLGRKGPGTNTKSVVEAHLAQLRVRLEPQIFRGLHHRCKAPDGEECDCSRRAVEITEGLVAALPKIRALLMTDVKAAFEGDPAATSADEVIFTYPGVQAISVYRVAHRLDALGAVIVPRMMTELAHSETGIDIHPRAHIDESFFIDHGTGVVIGETTRIGKRVRVYQGVTLGALSLPTGKTRELAHKKRHPTIEDDVIIYANATILGGETVIGKGATIGGNCFVTQSVDAGAFING